MLSRKVVKGKQYFFIFLQAFAAFHLAMAAPKRGVRIPELGRPRDPAERLRMKLAI
jgi:hypothetical protein